MVPVRIWGQEPAHHLWTSNRVMRGVTCGPCGCDSKFWRGPYYTSRFTGVRFRAVQNPGDIVRLAIVLSVMLSFKSVRFQQGVLLEAVRLVCAAQPGFCASSTIYVYKALSRC